jgi:hypothetical protein
VNEAVTPTVAVKPWLCQGDLFAKVPVLRAGITDRPEANLEDGPALLVSHSCSIDKKTKGKSRLEYLTFLPIHDLAMLPSERAATLRSRAWRLRPYEAMYLGPLTDFGEGYVNFTEPYTLPAVIFQPDLREFTDEETGEGDDSRIVLSFHNTRFATLSEDALELFQYKWMAHWTRNLPDPLPEGIVE